MYSAVCRASEVLGRELVGILAEKEIPNWATDDWTTTFRVIRLVLDL